MVKTRMAKNMVSKVAGCPVCENKGKEDLLLFIFLFVFVSPRRKMVTKMPYPAERSDKWRSEKMPKAWESSHVIILDKTNQQRDESRKQIRVD